jgi:hypothetical protein
MTQTSIKIQGGIFKGTGTVNGEFYNDVGAAVLPGLSPGTLTINGNFYSSGTLVFEIGGLGAGQYDILNINGNAYFTGGTIEFDFINGFNPSANDYWDFLFANTITGWNTLAFNFQGLGSGVGWEFDSGGGRLVIKENGGIATPEPATLILLGLGLVGIAGFRKKLKN